MHYTKKGCDSMCLKNNEPVNVYSEGNVCASIDYWADDNCFEARMLFDLYIIFLNIILDDASHSIKSIMKIIWS